MARYGKLFFGWMGVVLGRGRVVFGWMGDAFGRGRVVFGWMGMASARRLLTGGLLIAVLAPMGISCTSTSQIPLSVRERMEREARAAEEEFEADDPAQSPVVNRAELERLERERQRMLEERDARMQEQTNQALNHFVRAQAAFYDGRLEQALRFVRQGLSIQQTADFLAMEGSILWFMEETEQAAERWELALSLNADVVGALYPGLSEWIDSVQHSETDME